MYLQLNQFFFAVVDVVFCRFYLYQVPIWHTDFAGTLKFSMVHLEMAPLEYPCQTWKGYLKKKHPEPCSPEAANDSDKSRYVLVSGALIDGHPMVKRKVWTSMAVA